MDESHSWVGGCCCTHAHQYLDELHMKYMKLRHGMQMMRCKRGTGKTRQPHSMLQESTAEALGMIKQNLFLRQADCLLCNVQAVAPS